MCIKYLQEHRCNLYANLKKKEGRHQVAPSVRGALMLGVPRSLAWLRADLPGDTCSGNCSEGVKMPKFLKKNRGENL